MTRISTMHTEFRVCVCVFRWYDILYPAAI